MENIFPLPPTPQPHPYLPPPPQHQQPMLYSLDQLYPYVQQQQQQQPAANFFPQLQQQEPQVFLQPDEQQPQQEQGHGVMGYEYPESLLDTVPCGYRFSPTDAELIVHYLSKRMVNHILPENRIYELNVYAYSPDQITSMYPWDPLHNENEWFFFSPLSPKYPKGSRPSRAAGDGYWKPTGADKTITDDKTSLIIGYKKTLDYLRGKPPGVKTDWKMHEYRILQKGPRRGPVLCRLYTNTRQKKDEKNESAARKERMNENAAQDAFKNEVLQPNEGNNSIVSNTPSAAPHYNPLGIESTFGATNTFPNSGVGASSSQLFVSDEMIYGDQSLHSLVREFNCIPSVAYNKDGVPQS